MKENPYSPSEFFSTPLHQWLCLGSLSASNLLFTHTINFSSRVPPNFAQRLIRKSRLTCDERVATSVYFDLHERMFIVEVFLVITEQDNRDILLSSLIPLSARCYAELWVPAERCMELAGARTAKSGNYSQVYADDSVWAWSMWKVSWGGCVLAEQEVGGNVARHCVSLRPVEWLSLGHFKN